MAKPKAVALTVRQQRVVEHFARFIRDEAARDRYAALVESTLRTMPSFSDLNVTAAAIKAITDCRK